MLYEVITGIADVVAETGDEGLSTSLQSIWEDVVYKKMYVTGACGAHDRFAIGEKVVGEAYGKPYQLPRITSYNVCYTKLLRMPQYR